MSLQRWISGSPFSPYTHASSSAGRFLVLGTGRVRVIHPCCLGTEMLLPTMELHEGIWPSPTWPSQLQQWHVPKLFQAGAGEEWGPRELHRSLLGSTAEHSKQPNQRNSVLQEKLRESLKSTSLRQGHRFSTPEHYTCLFFPSGITGNNLFELIPGKTKSRYFYWCISQRAFKFLELSKT